MSTVLQSLNQGLHDAMAADSAVLLLGEDLLDPYGGAFKVSAGLSTRFPDRVLSTPISEAAITGVASGLALRGFRPVVEIMFGDFLTLAFDQLLNHACKFRGMYNGQVRLPLVVRTPMGGRRGYGPTHSQCIEKHMLGVPGLRVIAPNALGDAGELLRTTILQAEEPTLFVEHKLLYPRRWGEAALAGRFRMTSFGEAPEQVVRVLTVAGAPASQITIAAYGFMAELALEACWKLAIEHEVFAEVVVLTCLNPVDLTHVRRCVEKTGVVLVVEEGTIGFGWGSEVIAGCCEASGGRRGIRAGRVGAKDVPIPSSRPLEEAVLPGTDDVVEAALALVR